jgi:hypothetical protein
LCSSLFKILITDHNYKVSYCRRFTSPLGKTVLRLALITEIVCGMFTGGKNRNPIIRYLTQNLIDHMMLTSLPSKLSVLASPPDLSIRLGTLVQYLQYLLITAARILHPASSAVPDVLSHKICNQKSLLSHKSTMKTHLECNKFWIAICI